MFKKTIHSKIRTKNFLNEKHKVRLSYREENITEISLNITKITYEMFSPKEAKLNIHFKYNE